MNVVAVVAYLLPNMCIRVQFTIEMNVKKNKLFIKNYKLKLQNNAKLKTPNCTFTHRQMYIA